MTKKPAWVLVVDDDASDSMVLFRLLEVAGHHATVINGRSAVGLLRTEPFDLVLLAPSAGDSMVDSMADDATLRNTPVIVVRAVSDYEHLVGSLDAILDESDSIPR